MEHGLDQRFHYWIRLSCVCKMIVDNFALSLYDSCPALYDLRIRQRRIPIRRKPSLSFGGVVHFGLAEWYRKGTLEAALKAVVDHWPDVVPSEDFRTREYAARVLIEYVKHYPQETWKIVDTPEGKLVEVAFTLPTGNYLECQECAMYADPQDQLSGRCSNCGEALEEIEYGGIIDVGAAFTDILYPVDHKTTTVLGKEDSSYYFLQYNPDNQMTGYIWGLRKITDRKIGGAIINAIGIYKSGEVRFRRQITARNDYQIDRWLKGVVKKCNDIKRSERSNFWELRTNSCMNYGSCDFHSVHQLNDPVAEQRMLEQDYVISEWNHEARDD